MCPNILLTALKAPKFSFSGSILINLQGRFFSIAFCLLFLSQYFCHYDHFNQFTLIVYSHQNINQSCNLKKYCVCMFSPSNKLIMNVLYECSLSNVLLLK